MTSSRLLWLFLLVFLATSLVLPWSARVQARADEQPIEAAREQGLNDSERSEAARLARGVTIYRDSYGVPHIHGQTDAHVVFGFAYAQAEDYFWQIEDSYILGLG